MSCRRASLLLIVSILAPSCTSPKAPASRPVWWNPELGVGRVQDVPAFLKAPWASPVEARDAGNGAMTVSDCGAYLEASAAGMYAAAAIDQARWLSTGMKCQAVDALRTAMPSATSYVDALACSAMLVRFLPPRVGLVISDEESERVRRAESAGQSWQDYVKAELRVTQEAPHTCRVAAGDWTARVTEWGRGDWNGDGLEDLLVESDTAIADASYRTSRLFVLSRTGPDAVGSVLREWPPEPRAGAH